MQQQQEETAQTPGNMVQPVTVKLLPFWPHSLALWYSQAESLFILCGITDQVAKYYHVVSV
jgi:hypothetical protein